MEGAIVIGVGALEGVGAAAARRFARGGLHAFLAGRTAEKLEAVAAQIGSEGGSATAVPTDCTEPGAVTALFERVEKDTGAPPRLVLYNAGNNFPKDILEMTDDEFEGSWRVCGFGAFLSGREAARRMVPNGGGTLIFTGATASVRSRPPFIAFASAKAAERAIAHGLARQFGPKGLHVAHLIIDGVILGDQIKSRFPAVVDHLGEDGMLSTDGIADAMWMLHQQEPTTWTLELDLRPYKETF
ncbi:MAG: SDR family NAD(P)-dependent oxidoreductase [Myxococcota bacterium]|nr:SDR family NAD(P)-dependent oxidoreductase [Myxococcota bacterium]